LALFTVNALAQVAAPRTLPGTANVHTVQKMTEVRALPDNAMVQTQGGRVVSARTLKRLADAIQMAKKGQSAPASLPQFSRPQGAAQVQVKPGTDLHALAARPNNDVMLLPNGQKMTVGEFKALSELARRQTGRSIIERQPVRAAATGPVIKIKSNAELGKLADKPDATILENPQGQRITLGELRSYAKQHGRTLGEKK
jgi:hypothetical protein